MRWSRSTIVNAAAIFCAAGIALPGAAMGQGGDAPCLSLSDPTIDAQAVAEGGTSGPFLVTISDAAGVVARIQCADGSLERLVVRAEPGQRAEVQLLLANAGLEPVMIGHDMTAEQAWSSDWVHLEMFAGEVPAGDFLPISLVLDVPAGFEPGSRHEQQFVLIDEGERLALTVILEVIEEQPMFRDGFEIDPVLGQFSYRLHSGFTPGS
jgi:hypothetical protein